MDGCERDCKIEHKIEYFLFMHNDVNCSASAIVTQKIFKINSRINCASKSLNGIKFNSKMSIFY